MKKTLLLLSILAVLSLTAHAQISLFLRGGVSFPTFNFTNLKDKSVTSSSRVGFQAAAGALLSFPGSPLELEPAIQFAMRGTKMKTDLVTMHTYINYLDVPLMLNLAFTLGQTGVFVGAGPQFSYALNGATKYGNESVTLDVSKDLKNVFDISARVHGGLRLFGHQISLFYERGFLNILPSDTFKTYNSGWGVLYAYII